MSQDRCTLASAGTSHNDPVISVTASEELVLPEQVKHPINLSAREP